METGRDSRVDASDQVSLIELWIVLLRHKKLLWGVFALCLVTSVAVSQLRDASYLYSTSLEIGSFSNHMQQTFIDTPETVLSKLQEGYIPKVLADYYASTKGAERIDIRARVPKGSEVVVLEARGKASMAQTLKRLETEVTELLKQDHARTIDIKKSNLLMHRDNLIRKQAELKDQEKLLHSEKERIKVSVDLLEGQLAAVKAQVEEASLNRKKARTDVGDETRAMTLLMIDNELYQQRKLLASMEEQLYIAMPTKAEELDKSLADNRRAQENSQAEIDTMATVLKNIRETRFIYEPTASINPVGMARTTFVVIGALLGLMLGVFAAFIVEFLARFKHQKLVGEARSLTRPLEYIGMTNGDKIDIVEEERRSGTLG